MGRKIQGAVGSLEEAVQDPRSGQSLPPGWEQLRDRISVWEMSSYLPVLVRSRRQPRVAASASPTRTPATKPVMDPTGKPVVLASSEEEEREGNESQVKSGETRSVRGGRA